MLPGKAVEDAEQALGVRILAVDGDCNCGGDRTIAPGARLTVFGTMEALIRSAPRQSDVARRPPLIQRMRRALRDGHWRMRWTDPYIAGLIAGTLALFFAATWHFRDSFGIEWLTAAYFVTSTLTTTGYGDITPHRNDVVDVLTAMLLMLSGTIVTGIFIAIAAARLTRAQWVRMQGLRPIQRRGHIVLCGCGSIGTGVIDLLLAFDRPLVVIDPSPDAALIERARDRGFDLLTGDASRDDTLELCNLGDAHSLIALTNVDTLNLEIALGARARNPRMPIVLRIAEAEFAASIARHFDFETTFSVAALAGPVFAGLSRDPGARGRISFGDREFAIVETVLSDPADPAGDHGLLGRCRRGRSRSRPPIPKEASRWSETWPSCGPACGSWRWSIAVDAAAVAGLRFRRRRRALYRRRSSYKLSRKSSTRMAHAPGAPSRDATARRAASGGGSGLTRYRGPVRWASSSSRCTP